MTRTRRTTLLPGAAVVALTALTLAACSNSDQSSGAGATSGGGEPGTVDVASSDLGRILVDSQGSTLYLFQKDTGTQSECTGACATAWPPLRSSGTPTTGSGASASIGTTSRSDGKPQVTYNGHPVYLFSGDQQPGETNGEGVSAFGGSWFAVSPAGDQISSSSSNTGAAPGY